MNTSAPIAHVAAVVHPSDEEIAPLRAYLIARKSVSVEDGETAKTVTLSRMLDTLRGLEQVDPNEAPPSQTDIAELRTFLAANADVARADSAHYKADSFLRMLKAVTDLAALVKTQGESRRGISNGQLSVMDPDARAAKIASLPWTTRTALAHLAVLGARKIVRELAAGSVTHHLAQKNADADRLLSLAAELTDGDV